MRRGTSILRSVVLSALVAAALATVGRSAGALEPPTKTIYLALGDSYSSGEGLGPFLPGSGKCDRSPEAYPQIVARRIGALTLKFVACSGATIAQIDQQVSGVAPRTLRHVAMTTVTAGGNDLPLSGLITACMEVAASPTSIPIEYLPGASSPTLCASAIRGAATLLGAGINTVTGDVTMPVGALKSPLSRPSPFETRLLTLYRLILTSEGAKKHQEAGPWLLVVQYPSLLGPPGANSCVLSPTALPPVGSTTTNGPIGPLFPAFSSASSYALRDINRYVQLEISVVVGALRRDGYLDVSLVTSGVDFAPLNCATGTSPDVNGVLVSDAPPEVESGSFHPTAVGQAALASSVLVAWRTITR